MFVVEREHLTKSHDPGNKKLDEFKISIGMAK